MSTIMQTNYTNTAQVVDEFKSALMKYRDYLITKKGGNENVAVTYLKEAGQFAYSSMEHAYKNYLHRYYNKQYYENQIDYETLTEKLNFLTEKTPYIDTGNYRFATHNDLMEEFCSIVNEPAANLLLILNESQDGNNDIKHVAEVPDSKQLLLSLLEMKKFFMEYISSDVYYPDLTIDSLDKNTAFLNIRTYCNSFSDLFSYVYVSGIGEGYSDEEAKNLFSINWDLIIDFDPYTQNNGIYEQYIRIKQHSMASVKKLEVRENNKFTRSLEEAHWIIANGIEGEENSICTTDREWRKKHGRNLGKMLQNFKSSYIKPIKMFVSESVSDVFLEEFISICSEAFFDENEDIHKGIQVFLLNGKERLIGYDEDFLERVDLSDSEFLNCIKTGVTNIRYDEDELLLPGISQDNGLGKELRIRLKNFCEVLYDGIEKNDPIGTQYEYYRGERAIYWNELNNGVDIKRTEYEQHTKHLIREILNKQPYSYYEINYRPGFGGTTLMRRIAWDFHGFLPTMILYRYEKEDEEVLRQFTLKLTQPLLILMDSNFVKKEIAETVVSDLKAWNESHLIIYINRIRSNNFLKSSASLLSVPELNEGTGEIKRLIDILRPFTTKDICRERLLKLEKQPELIEEKSPVFFALTAFDEEFVGIRPYITHFMRTISEEYRKFLVYLAIADYINKPIDIEFFGNILHTDMPKDIMQENTAFSTLVTYVDSYDRQTFCKLKFPAVGAEILRQATNGFSADTGEKIKFINLTDYIIDFISTSNITEEIPNKNIVDFLVELLITRHEDYDSNKPQFSEMITQIGTAGNIVTGKKWPHEGEAAVERIFQALVKTYKSDSHFKAHLARFKSYIQEDYDSALKFINEAIDDERETGKIDSLLLHMKAMVYSTKITSKYIPEIKKAKNENNLAVVNELLQELRLNLHEAEKLFEEVRKKQRGVAGHISDISLCINVIDMGRVLEEKDTAVFLSDHYGDWYMDLADRANILYDVCEEYMEELDHILNKAEIEKIKEIGNAISTIRNGIDKTIELYQSYLLSADESIRPKIRRHLARAYEERNGKKDWATISELMMENIQEDPNNESNIRIWFKAILHLKEEDPDETLRNAIELLNRWINNDDKNLEAHYYRYILTFIEAVEGISGSEGRLKDYLVKMRDLSKDRPNKTSIRYWLGKNGRGIERLIHKNKFPLTKTIEANKMLYLLKGTVSRYSKENHAYIDAYRTEIFFNPSQTEGRINESDKNKQVIFGVGFSFDGPRAYNSSVELYTGTQMLPQTEMEPLRKGMKVQCQVINTQSDDYIDVKILRYNEIGSIHVTELSDPYNSNNRPKVNGPFIDAWTIRKKSINLAGQGNKIIWDLSMNSPKEKLTYKLGDLFKENNIIISSESEEEEHNIISDQESEETNSNIERSKIKTQQTSIEENESDENNTEITGQNNESDKPQVGKTYIMRLLSFDKNKKTINGVITINNCSFTAVVPSCTKKRYDEIKKKESISVKVVQETNQKYVVKI